ncbi:unnamed protein product, partial [Linum tenue]
LAVSSGPHPSPPETKDNSSREGWSYSCCLLSTGIGWERKQRSEGETYNSKALAASNPW